MSQEIANQLEEKFSEEREFRSVPFAVPPLHPFL
jgi:hypothetical protein